MYQSCPKSLNYKLLVGNLVMKIENQFVNNIYIYIYIYIKESKN